MKMNLQTKCPFNIMNVSKKCYTCGAEKPLALFSKNPEMRDGRVNQCKTCESAIAKIRYLKNKQRHLAVQKAYQATPEGKACNARKYAQAKIKKPLKLWARRTTNNHILNGRLKRQLCEVCAAADAEAHHENYSKPLEVRWLCFDHHRAHHQKESVREGQRIS